MASDVFPICCKCKKLVDTMEWYDDYSIDDRIYIAHCHGEKEKTVIHKEQMMWPCEIKAGFAFNKKEISNG